MTKTVTTKLEALTEADQSQTQGRVASVTAGETATQTTPQELDNFSVFTLKRTDGAEKEIYFEPEPDWILIKGTGISNGECTPAFSEHDRFDFNERNIKAWNKKMWIWLNGQMKEFSNGKSVKAFYLNPYFSIGGYFPNV